LELEDGGIILQRDEGRKGIQGGLLMDEIAEAIRAAASEGGLTCAAAFSIAQRLRVEPLEVGQQADALAVRLSRCQLGLFGYGPKSEGKHRRVSAMSDVPSDLEAAIRSAAQRDGKLSCAAAWSIADDLSVSRQTVSDAAEGLDVRIRDCQLGAF
jgi:hypothetical protein